ncbi:MAG: hypothetical protein QM770_03780 [Tepidisphaeraceae bacterium]
MLLQLAQVATAGGLSDLTSLGAAGLIGAMWLWERRSNAQREQMIEEAHQRILADKVQLDALVDLVKQNTEALTRLMNGVVIDRTEEKR